MIFNAAVNLAQPGVIPDCLRDLTHEATQPINSYLTTHTTLKHALVIISSLMIDVTVVVLAATWIIFGKNMRVFLAIITFFLFKIFLQEVFFFRLPEGYIWEYPGFPSLTTPYYPANDFFFSGQIGLCMIGLMEFRTNKMSIMKYFSLLTIVFGFFVMISTRAHYIIDLTTGVVAGHYFFLVGTWLDNSLQKRNNGNFGIVEENHKDEHKPLLQDMYPGTKQ